MLLFFATGAAQAGNGSICVLVFDDTNRNGTRDSGEALLPDVSINLLVNETVIVANHVTDGKEPFCFQGLAPQQYTVAISSPLYQSTTLTSSTLSLNAGERATREFGAALPQATAEATDSSLLPDGSVAVPVTQPVRIGLSAAAAIIAMVFFVGLGLILYGLFVMRRRQ